MGSLRNPIGPLPSSIYWRRRAVALALFIVILLLVIWAFGWGGAGGDGGRDEGKGSGGGGAASTITPGPTSSTPVNSQRPGGRDESDDGGTGTGDSDGGGSGDGGDGGTGGGSDTGDAGGVGGAGGGGGGTGGGLGIGDGRSIPAGSSLPACTRSAVELTVRSVKDSRVKNTYEPGEEPTFELTVKNSSGTACKVDFGRASATLTITDSENDHVWASDDCPEGSKSVLVEVAGNGQTKRTVHWDRKRSVENCATPAGSVSAKAGTYLVEAKVEGLGTARVSFVLDED
ncbi:hypothetical protein SBI_05980 [Streptomyces bingchenggensis BCW-1]|uniref:Uncharacterized protein n=1 Tax=Streptomyces bingchenggensis (strain BCW-1) TaxID=749414 RepID=D7CHQ0_STRBB|nr:MULTISPECIES: hypothetical protein [Streptomyces]ADI09100.1 hypothetical protein SBI_05980 [Streptomyces bingchenggensis BCW-1]